MPFQLMFDLIPESDGLLEAARVPWDSDLFGFPVYELRCNDEAAAAGGMALATWLDNLEARSSLLVSAKIPSRAIAMGLMLTRLGFYPVETMFELYAPLARLNLETRRMVGAVQLRPATKVDLPDLTALAQVAFAADRFHLDPNLSDAVAGRRYAHWVENAVESGDLVHVFESSRDRRLVGFFHLRDVGTSTVDLSLAAVDPTYQRSGLGVLMYQAVLRSCLNQGYRASTTRIAAHNLNVLNLFARLGFAFQHPVLTVHWFRSGSRLE